jgi:hypothetical protein
MVNGNGNSNGNGKEWSAIFGCIASAFQVVELDFMSFSME